MVCVGGQHQSTLFRPKASITSPLSVSVIATAGYNSVTKIKVTLNKADNNLKV